MKYRRSLPSNALRQVALAAAVVCAPWSVALAQQAATTAPAAPASTEAGKLTTVTVTAERRTENIKDVPISVSTVGGEKLDVLQASGQDVRVLSGRVPSLNIESSFGRAFPRFYIRGYGNTDFRQNASQPVSLIYDDVVQENPVLKGFPIFDLERVEVLAGPQGTLFGRNTPAGVVKLDSVKPSQKQEAYISGSYGTFGTRVLEGAANLPLNGDWAVRISGQTQNRDGFVTNDRRPADGRLEGYVDQALRIQASYAPKADFSALLNFHARDLNGTARLFRANIIQPGTNDLVPGFDINRVAIDGINQQNVSSQGGSLRLKWQFDGVTLHSITGLESVKAFSRGDVDAGFGASFAPPFGPGFIPFPVETADGIRDHNQLTQEVRLESRGSGPFSWQAGAYYFQERYNFDAFEYNSLAPGNPQTSRFNSRQTNDAFAIFGSVNYAITDRLKIRGGLRFTTEKKELNTVAVQGAFAVPGGRTASNTKDNEPSFDVSATYALDSNVNVYGRFATGFRGSSIQPAGPFGGLTQAGPETIRSVEVGVKADLLDKRARLSASLFNYEVKNQQLTAVGGATNSTSLINAKKTIGQGIEGTFDAYLLENLLITLGGSYNLTKIKDGSLQVFGCGSCTVTDPRGSIPGTFRIDGNPLPNAPKYIANATARYGIPAGQGAEFFVYGDLVYRSKVNFFLYESVEFTGKSLLETGLRLGYNWGDGKYEVAVFGRNLGNQVRVTGGIDFNNLTGFVNEPRTYGIQLRAAL